MKKRGVLLVVLIVLVIFSTSQTLADLTRYPAFAINTDDDVEDETVLGKYCSSSAACTWGDECDEEQFKPGGCIVYSYDEGLIDDGCYSGRVPPGVNIDNHKKDLTARGNDVKNAATANLAFIQDYLEGVSGTGISGITTDETSFVGSWTLGIAIAVVGLIITIADALGAWGDDEATEYYAGGDFRFKDSMGVLCSSDGYWYRCDKNNAEALMYIEQQFKIDELETKIPYLAFRCEEINEYEYAWVKQNNFDLDHDGWTIENGDCWDNPVYNMLMECPQLDNSVYQGLNSTQIQEEMQSMCNPVLHHNCPACINPGMPEVCGDNINNDCGGIEAGEPVSEPADNIGGKTSDNCNENEFACTQTSPAPSGEEGCDPATDENCIVEPKILYNIFDQQFSWLKQDNGEGYCCGYGGILDLGVIKSGTVVEQPGDYLCLNRNDEVLGREPAEGYDSGIAGWPTSGNSEPTSEDRCQGDWCWINAEGAANFKIFTIKPNIIAPYDVVPNGQDWFNCNETAQRLDSPTLYENRDKANRFQCYQEGNRWSWAECLGANDPQAGNGVKTRGQGDGVYNLPITLGETYAYVDVENSYANYYGDLPVSMQGNLSFMVRFTQINSYPANLILQIVGQDNKIYYQNPVLGYATNNPYLETNHWINVEVPLPELVGVTLINFYSIGTNKIEVRNANLITEEPPKICSGETSFDYSSWLTDLDFWQSGNPISGEKICNELYDPNYVSSDPLTEGEGIAWLGTDVPAENRCCGNSPQEYYAGLSEPHGDPAVHYGCWNSQPIKEGETIMNVEFEVGYTQNLTTTSYPTITVSPTVEINYTTKDYSSITTESCSETSGIPYGTRFIQSYESNGAICPTGSTCTCQVESGCGVRTQFQANSHVGQVTCTLTQIVPPSPPLEGRFNYDCGQNIYGTGTFTDSLPVCQNTTSYEEKKTNESITLSFSSTLSYKNGSVQLGLLSPLIQPILLGAPFTKLDSIELKNGGESVYFYDSFYGKLDPLLGSGDVDLYSHLFVMAENNQVNINSEASRQHADFTYSCDKTECYYPLPGSPPYTITNQHPELYDLYFVSKTNPDGIIITPTNNPFNEEGNLKVKKISQQVLFSYNGGDPHFYGCVPASYIETATDYLLPQDYCSVKDGYFCSYSVTYDDPENSRQRPTTINSWSTQGLTEIGYQDLTPEEIPENYEEMKDITLTPIPEVIGPELRSFQAPTLPSRNLLSNANFEVTVRDLNYWTIYGAEEENEKQYVTEDLDTGSFQVTLNSEILSSERIAVEQNTNYQFSNQGTAEVTITLVDKDGQPTEVETEFNSEDASYLIIKFTQGTVLQPMLQKVDSLGPIDFYYNDKIERAGAACCPENFCWNGYTCVQPMNTSIYLAEYLPDGRTYRCIDGKWEYRPVKLDWNENKWGFCTGAEQCFVSREGTPTATAQNFYTTNTLPACISEQEYIFDHYCEQGNWTSRTKYLAGDLLKIAEDEDYILYCTNYQNALLNYNDEDQLIIGGEFTQTLDVTLDIGQTLSPTTPETIYTFLQNPPSNLISQRENTRINNVCLLKFKKGTEKVAFATTLNLPLTHEDSILNALFNGEIPSESITDNDVCPEEDGFFKCDLEQFNLEGGELWYSPALNAIIYSQDGFEVEGVWNSIVEFFDGLFSGEAELAEETDFIQQARNFRELYLLKQDDKTVKALFELLPDKQTILAEYEGFTTPLCQYVDDSKINRPEFQTELLSESEGRSSLACINNDSIQRIEAVGSNDDLLYIWPQLTGKLRVR